jgi:hypothetical protein
MSAVQKLQILSLLTPFINAKSLATVQKSPKHPTMNIKKFVSIQLIQLKASTIIAMKE